MREKKKRGHGGGQKGAAKRDSVLSLECVAKCIDIPGAIQIKLPFLKGGTFFVFLHVCPIFYSNQIFFAAVIKRLVQYKVATTSVVGKDSSHLIKSVFVFFRVSLATMVSKCAS